MSCFRVFVIASLLLTTGAAPVAAEDQKDVVAFKGQFKADLERCLPGVGADNIPDRAGPQQQIQDFCFQAAAPGRELQRAAACQVIAEALAAPLAKPAQIWLLKQLERIGREESLDAAAKWLSDGDEEIRAAALSALANNPVPRASAILLGKLPDSKGAFRVVLINALGYRADSASIATLAPLLRDGDPSVAVAAARALGTIGGPEAANALKAMLPGAAGALRDSIADAYLRCAERLFAEGKVHEAAAMYDELNVAANSRAVRRAALTGKLKAAGETARARRPDPPQTPGKDTSHKD